MLAHTSSNNELPEIWKPLLDNIVEKYNPLKVRKGCIEEYPNIDLQFTKKMQNFCLQLKKSVLCIDERFTKSLEEGIWYGAFLEYIGSKIEKMPANCIIAIGKDACRVPYSTNQYYIVFPNRLKRREKEKYIEELEFYRTLANIIGEFRRQEIDKIEFVNRVAELGRIIMEKIEEFKVAVSSLEKIIQRYRWILVFSVRAESYIPVLLYCLLLKNRKNITLYTGEKIAPELPNMSLPYSVLNNMSRISEKTHPIESWNGNRVITKEYDLYMLARNIGVESVYIFTNSFLQPTEFREIK